MVISFLEFAMDCHSHTRRYTLKLLLLAFWSLSLQTAAAVTGTGDDQLDYNQLFSNYPKASPKKIGGGRKRTDPGEDGPTRPTATAAGCARRDIFFSFNPKCEQEVARVAEILMAEPTVSAVIRKANSIRSDPDLHPRVWFAALTRVSLSRPDMQGLSKPNPEDVVPDVFIGGIGSKNIGQAATTPQINDVDINLRSMSSSEQGQCIILDENFASQNGIENRLWYFREDIHMNSHHWYWHITHPVQGLRTDRGGEIFYYIHHSMLARYNAERLSNGLPPAKPMKLTRNYTLGEPYFPNMVVANAGQVYANRSANTKLPESVPELELKLDDLILKYGRVQDALKKGFFVDSIGAKLPLETARDINLVGDTIESYSSGSANHDFYGAVHGDGHNMISFAHADSKIPGVMADTSTSMRDFIFYEWHTLIDDIFELHNANLPPYEPTSGPLQLKWSPVTITNVEVRSNSGAKNVLETFWSVKKFNLERGIDLEDNNETSTTPICAKHLNHEEFTYNINVNLNGPSERPATVRIFLAPRNTMKGTRMPFSVERRLFFVMDQFTVQLKPGLNVITRKSEETPVTIPWRQAYDSTQDRMTISNVYCGCGWPHHLLLPKGSGKGTEFDLFTMITNGQEDEVYQTNTTPNQCEPAFPLCGLPGKKYPDLKPMGYPFDRPSFTVPGKARNGQPRKVVDLEEYKSYIPNSFVTKLVIKHKDKVQ